MRIPAKSRRVGVLMGGCSAEYEVSLRTGEGVADALESRGYDVARLTWGPDADDLYERLRASDVDVVFLALHGRGGEDGCVQGMLELMGIPYTGSGVLGSALAMDKLKAKEMFRLHNVPTPPYYVVQTTDLGDLEALHGSFGFPAIVKPQREGSSVGLAKVDDLASLESALRRALAFDGRALVERFVRAMEVHVGILDGQVLGAIEVAPRDGLYDYRAKYTAGLTEYICPPRLAATRLRGVLNLAERASRALACDGACRVDLLVTEGQNEYVLEVNTLPGLTSASLLPKIAASAGLDYPSLCERILESASLHAGLPARAETSGARRRPPHRSQVMAREAEDDTASRRAAG